MVISQVKDSAGIYSGKIPRINTPKSNQSSSNLKNLTEISVRTITEFGNYIPDLSNKKMSENDFKMAFINRILDYDGLISEFESALLEIGDAQLQKRGKNPLDEICT